DPVWQRDHPVLKPGGHFVHCSFLAPPFSTFFSKNLYLKALAPTCHPERMSQSPERSEGEGSPGPSSPLSYTHPSIRNVSAQLQSLPHQPYTLLRIALQLILLD